MNARRSAVLLALLALLALAAGCARHEPAAGPAAPHRHEHHPPHGGTPVVLGAELYHLELVRDATAGTLSAYVLDGELGNFIRITQPELRLDAVVAGRPQVLVLAAVADPATGETVGDTALFAGRADWLRTTAEFDAVLAGITIRGTAFTAVKFNFPRGNDTD